MKKKRISVYVRNDRDAPSPYYRIIQYTQNIHEPCFKYRVLVPTFLYKFQMKKDSRNKIIQKFIESIVYLNLLVRATVFLLCDLFIFKPKITIVCREIFPRFMPILFFFLLQKYMNKSQFIWDFDDAILKSGEISKREASLLMKNSAKIVVTHKTLKNMLPTYYQNKVIELPTTDAAFQNSDVNSFLIERKKTFEETFIIIWVGTSGNLHYINNIILELDDVANELLESKNKKMVLKIICNNNFMVKTKYLEIQNIAWSHEVTIKEMKKAHLGIMPLTNTSYSLGKGGFKLIQYLAAGIPVIGDAVGYNNTIVENGKNGYLVERKEDWKKNILNINSDLSIWSDMCSYARISWEKSFSFKSNLKEWNRIIKEILTIYH
jgi:glycosyltransferase involved in cell wall biosynthesis